MEDLNVQTIAIPVEEYKELIQKQAELSLIYHKGAGGSVYDIGNFVLDLMLAVHPHNADAHCYILRQQHLFIIGVTIL